MFTKKCILDDREKFDLNFGICINLSEYNNIEYKRDEDGKLRMDIRIFQLLSSDLKVKELKGMPVKAIDWDAKNDTIRAYHKAPMRVKNVANIKAVEDAINISCDSLILTSPTSEWVDFIDLQPSQSSFLDDIDLDIMRCTKIIEELADKEMVGMG